MGTRATDPAGKSARTRERLLQAARELLPGSLREGLEHSLGPVAVSRRAGVSRQTWYRHWGADGDPFVEDLVEYLLPISRGVAGVINDSTSRLGPGSEPLGVEAATMLASSAFHISADPEFLLSRHIAFALAIEERIVAEREGRETGGGVTALVREYFDRYTDTLVDAIGQILDSWGREPAPPFELRDLAVILTAMAAGISFRRSVDPESVPDNLGRDAILLLAPSLTRVAPGRDDRAPAVVAGSGSEHAGVAHSAQRAAGRRRVQRSRSAIIAAAWREFDLRGYADASIAAIAAGADVSETTVYEHFWSKAGVARACYEVEYRELSRALETDAAEPVARIRNHVVRLAALLRDHPALPAAVLDGFGQMGDIGREIHARDPRRLTPLPVPLVGPIREAKSAGRIRTDLKSIDIATAITTLTVVQVSHRPESSAESIARQVGAMTLDGVLTTAVREAADGDVAQDRT